MLLVIKRNYNTEGCLCQKGGKCCEITKCALSKITETA